jgi:tetratricopeptide (TPR) repeat protein
MARKGYAPAQFKLGLIYVNGNGVPQDYREALKWYRKAADQGNAAAQRNLGVMFGEGLGVPQDYAEALKWFRRAAEQNDAAAQTNLGVMYDFGHGATRRFIRVIDELVEPYARFWTHTEITVVVKPQIGHASIPRVNQFLGIDGATTRKHPTIGFRLWFYRCGAADGFLAA